MSNENENIFTENGFFFFENNNSLNMEMDFSDSKVLSDSKIFDFIKNCLEENNSFIFSKNLFYPCCYDTIIFGIKLNPEKKFLCKDFFDYVSLKNRYDSQYYQENYSKTFDSKSIFMDGKFMSYSKYWISKNDLCKEISKIYKISKKINYLFAQFNPSIYDENKILVDLAAMTTDKNLYSLYEIKNSLGSKENPPSEKLFQEDEIIPVLKSLEKLNLFNFID